MSAIAGIWHLDGRPDAAARCARMLASQQIYGPHDGRQSSDGAFAAGRRLFRTLPEDAQDRQPVRSADGRLMLVADVRLDNREELLSALGRSSGGARLPADAEILLLCLERWDEQALDRLVGDFAFALWDQPAQKLLLARDFLGQRPLHYHSGKHFFAFASMPKGLHALPEIPYAPDRRTMAEFVTLMPQVGTGSFFEHVARVEAGHVLTVTRDGVRSRRYWQPEPVSGGSGRRDYAEGLRHHFDEATRARLRGAGGLVASQLSGGLDSAAVTATAARLLAAEAGRVVAYTAVPRKGYDGPCPANRFGDEGPLAAATAAMHPNIEHVPIATDARSPLGQLDRYFFLFDQPALNLCNWVWIDAINAAARERGIGVLLTGQMGNMSISYGGLEYLAELLGRGRMLRLASEGAKLVARGGASWRSVLAHSLGPYLPQRLWQRINRAHGRNHEVLDYTAISPARLREMERAAAERGLDFSYRPRKSAFETRLWVLGRFDVGNYNKGVLAGWGLDQRDPTADRRLIEYCLAAPMEAYVAGGETRRLARRAFADRLPKAVLEERRKGYQAVDWHEGVAAARSEMEAELGRIAPCAAAADTLDVAKMQALIAQMPIAGWDRQDVIGRYRLALLRGVSAGHFLRKASGSND